MTYVNKMMTRGDWQQAPCNPGMRPDGIRERAYRAALARSGRTVVDRWQEAAAYWDSVRSPAQNALIAEARSRKRKRDAKTADQAEQGGEE